MNISQKNIEMIELARNNGASAKFTGSGGAIIGQFHNEKMYEDLQAEFSRNHITVIKPRII